MEPTMEAGVEPAVEARSPVPELNQLQKWAGILQQKGGENALYPRSVIGFRLLCMV